jgi:hypothetical protein
MDLKRLFHVLVVGGSVAAGCERSRTSGLSVADGAGTPDVGMTEPVAAPEDAAADTGAAEDAMASVDAVASEDASMNTDATADTVASKDAAADGPIGNPCFCSPTKCCDLHDGAPATVQAGLYCCWGTTC